VNTEWALNHDGNPDDHWRVDGPRLCVLNHALSQDEHCYTIAVTPDGRVQFYIDAPGDEFDGRSPASSRSSKRARPGRTFHAADV
jgi:hypothetical protein